MGRRAQVARDVEGRKAVHRDADAVCGREVALDDQRRVLDDRQVHRQRHVALDRIDAAVVAELRLREADLPVGRQLVDRDLRHDVIRRRIVHLLAAVGAVALADLLVNLAHRLIPVPAEGLRRPQRALGARAGGRRRRRRLT